MKALEDTVQAAVDTVMEKLHDQLRPAQDNTGALKESCLSSEKSIRN